MSVDLRAAFSAWRAKHVRRAWKPVCLEGSAGAARFGGSPLLMAGEPWPSCAACHRPMQFFLQLSLASMPAGVTVRGEGMLQLFSCSADDGSCETWRPFSGAHLVRLLNEPASAVAHPLGLAPFPVRSIESWSELADYPHPEEHRALGLVYDYDFPNKRVNVSCPGLGVEVRDLDIELDVAETIADAAHGDKLGGWPAWIQRAEYPACPDCGRVMALAFQVDSEDNVPHMFGDAGCGHITQCPDHPQVLAFGWACS